MQRIRAQVASGAWRAVSDSLATGRTLRKNKRAQNLMRRQPHLVARHAYRAKLSIIFLT